MISPLNIAASPCNSMNSEATTESDHPREASVGPSPSLPAVDPEVAAQPRFFTFDDAHIVSSIILHNGEVPEELTPGLQQLFVSLPLNALSGLDSPLLERIFPPVDDKAADVPALEEVTPDFADISPIARVLDRDLHPEPA